MHLDSAVRLLYAPAPAGRLGMGLEMDQRAEGFSEQVCPSPTGELATLPLGSVVSWGDSLPEVDGVPWGTDVYDHTLPELLSAQKLSSSTLSKYLSLLAPQGHPNTSSHIHGGYEAPVARIPEVFSKSGIPLSSLTHPVPRSC